MKHDNPYAAPSSDSAGADPATESDAPVLRRQAAIAVAYAAALAAALVYASAPTPTRIPGVSSENAVAATAIAPSAAPPVANAADTPAATGAAASTSPQGVGSKEPEGNVVDMTY